MKLKLDITRASILSQLIDEDIEKWEKLLHSRMYKGEPKPKFYTQLLELRDDVQEAIEFLLDNET